MLNFRRKRILRQRQEAVTERLAAARAYVAATREAEEALAAMKAANDKFYQSDRAPEAAALSSLRRERERVFVFHAMRELVAEAPHLARLLGIRVSVTGAMPLVAWIEHTNNTDLSAVETD